MNSRNNVPADQELEILKILWQRGSATAREVFDELSKHRPVPYTTLLTRIGVLEQKGYIRRTPGVDAYVYSSAHSQQQVLDRMLREFTDRVFDGSAERLVARLIDNPELDPEEIGRIRALLSASGRAAKADTGGPPIEL